MLIVGRMFSHGIKIPIVRRMLLSHRPFLGINGNHPHQVNPNNNANDFREAAYPSNGSKPTNQVQIVGNQVLASPPTSNQWGTNQFSVTKLSDDQEAKSIELPVPCENLLTEVINRLQAPPQSFQTPMKNRRDENNDMVNN
ncbi:hypothetical protein Ddye_027445 [Dipteronia dyeriana]|uniref:Uncharacterized protein n=1 Tax=Dipteronia dyeriana TaxID=168575 RepID=A0AAD9TP45_9ROSI|nr:hypothetical protein Ddye_027445 [Dipteronia dyeriana]